MVCQTIKVGSDCPFMSKRGCNFNGGFCNVIVEQCEGCSKTVEYSTGKYCKVYPDPVVRWYSGKCPTATHVKVDIKENIQKLNPLKASKRANKK
ncbi:MAG: PxxKW family cysteine-rich protein [Syntrophales bacterium]